MKRMDMVLEEMDKKGLPDENKPEKKEIQALPMVKTKLFLVP